MKALSFKIDEKQFKLLEKVSKETQIPKSVLIREGIKLIVCKHREDLVSPELKSTINQMLQEDSKLLDKLAE